ncbi:hypothetical protein L1987_54067 [Smallanthus sonchifolius]|uniref:Uncharacterized protein n=1 Tax=Smallanthus sonchifolius TaxID=185202 RepID=A0ACB9E770_9ASTR|nr:hypothetical protein L1987_54067 [Smallanthus sonchifolius]
MCDTSYRHSNCFDQFRKSFSEGQLPGPSNEQNQPSMMTDKDEMSNGERDEDSTSGLSFDDGSWLTVLFLIRVFRPGNTSGPVSSRTRAQVTLRRRPRTRLWGEGNDGEAGDGDTSDGETGSGPRNLFQLIRRRPTPDNDDEL